MIDRINKNEEKLNRVINSINDLNNSLIKFKNIKKDLSDINKYYGSKNWFKDKDYYEKGKIPNINAGILSEDTVWNLNEDIDDLIDTMQNIIEDYKKGKI